MTGGCGYNPGETCIQISLKMVASVQFTLGETNHYLLTDKYSKTVNEQLYRYLSHSVGHHTHTSHMHTPQVTCIHHMSHAYTTSHMHTPHVTCIHHKSHAYTTSHMHTPTHCHTLVYMPSMYSSVTLKRIIHLLTLSHITLCHPTHICRVLFGSSHLYVFHHPKELKRLLASGKKPEAITYDTAQEEIATNSGFDMSTEGKSKDDILLQQDLISLMPMVYEANAISEELNRKVSSENNVKCS